MEDYFQAKRLLFASPLTAGADRQRRRPLRPAADRRVPGRVTFAIDARGRLPRGRRAHGRDGLRLRRGHAGRRVRGARAAARALQRAQRAGARGPRRGRSASPADGARRRRWRPPRPRPGRFQPVEAGQPFARASSTTRTSPTRWSRCCSRRASWPPGALIVVVGAGGDRDRGKRPLMGEIAARLADVALITSDNPRSEAPEAIIDEILAGIPASPHAAVERDADRRASIFRAIALARARRRRGDRGQGPRAGPGVRGRPQGAVRRRRGRARGDRERGVA